MSTDRLVDVYEDLAMVSKIRVEVRGGSMKAAERVASLFLDHARLVGLFEGIVPQSSRYTDHFFNYPQMIGKPSDPPDPWSELGMRYYGRMALSCDPEVAFGGLKQFGYEVTQVDDFAPYGLAGHPGSESEPVRTEVAEKVIVLNRVNEVTRESILSLEETPPEEADAEAILDNIRRLVNVEDVKVGYDHTQRDGSGWRVDVTFKRDEDAPAEKHLGGEFKLPNMMASAPGETLREAALSALGMCGVEVMHFDTVPRVER